MQLRIKQDQRGISNVIVVMLSLVLVVNIVANVVLWSYQMNQLDWEKMQEDISITNVERINRSSWFSTQSEYTVNTGSRINGSYEGTQAVDDGRWETFQEKQPPVPSTVGTTSTRNSIQYPYQRKTFYANGLFWVFYSDGSNLVYRTSSDGSSWSAATTVRTGCDYGYYFSVWFDWTYVHYTCGRGRTGEALFYRRGTPDAEGTITWSTASEEVAGGAVPTVTYYRRQTWAEGNLWVMDSSYSTTANYTTEIVTGNYTCRLLLLH